jgi:hypothetical protein
MPLRALNLSVASPVAGLPVRAPSILRLPNSKSTAVTAELTLDTPLINFHYFDEGSDTAGEDLQSVVAGIRFVRKLTEKLMTQGFIAAEEQPGEALQTDEQLMDFVRNVAWGHHASCTCAIGPREGVACSAAIFGCTAPRDYVSSTRRYSPGYPVSLSPVRSIWSAKRRRT